MTDLEWFVLIYGAIGVWVSYAIEAKKGTRLDFVGSALVVPMWGFLLLLGLLRKALK